jgi:hypothetical protein
LNPQTEKILKEFLDKIPPDLTNSPEKLTDYVKFQA